MRAEPKGARASLFERAAASRAHVMRERGAFEAVLRVGSRMASRNFLVRARPNEGTHARLGIIAAKKTASRAVDRNRGKRLIREAFQAIYASIGAYDVIVQLRNDLRSQPTSALRPELRRLLETLAQRRIDTSATRPDRQ